MQLNKCVRMQIQNKFERLQKIIENQDLPLQHYVTILKGGVLNLLNTHTFLQSMMATRYVLELLYLNNYYNI